jgi:MFS family permease
MNQLHELIGDFGLWQTNIALCCITAAIFSAFNGLSSAFYAPQVDFSCRDLDFPASNGDQCQLNGTSCNDFDYFPSEFGHTAVQEWDLVCDKSYLPSLSQSAYMLGISISAIVFGYFSDKYGRKWTVVVAVVIEIAAGLLSAFSNSISLFIFARFLLAFGCYGRNLTAFLIGIEVVGPKYRAVIGIAYQLGWAFGYIALPGIAYLLKDFRHLLLATTVPEIIWLFWFMRLPESPRWLLTHNKLQEAEEIVMQAIHTNSRDATDVRTVFARMRQEVDLTHRHEQASDQKSKSGGTFLDLWKDRTMTINTVIFFFTWFANAFVYYGISLNIGEIGGNLYWNFFLAGLVEFPSYILCMASFRYIGRRPLLAVTMLGAGICCFAIVLLCIHDRESMSVWIQGFAIFGKFWITISFGLIYVYTAEIYPTVFRQIGVGACSVVGRTGSILAPFVKELITFTSFGLVMSIFGGLSILTFLLSMKLPETKDTEMPDTMQDATNRDKGQHSREQLCQS